MRLWSAARIDTYSNQELPWETRCTEAAAERRMSYEVYLTFNWTFNGHATGSTSPCTMKRSKTPGVTVIFVAKS